MTLKVNKYIWLIPSLPNYLNTAKREPLIRLPWDCSLIYVIENVAKRSQNMRQMTSHLLLPWLRQFTDAIAGSCSHSIQA